MEEYRQLVREVTDQVNRVILGKKKEVEEIMLSFLAGGHVLLEDIPGVGKTTMALAFSRAMDLEYRRIQFTPDVLPSDLTGFSIYRRETSISRAASFAICCWRMKSTVRRPRHSQLCWRSWRSEK